MVVPISFQFGGSMQTPYFRIIGTSFLLSLTLVGFQNCSKGGFEVLQASSTNASGIAGLDNSGAGANTDSGVGNSSGNTSLPSLKVAKTYPGFIFSANYRASESDLTGVTICDYPNKSNCKSDADGKSKGRSFTESSGLSANSNVHKISFDFYSNGYFANNRDAHLAIGLRGNITNDSNNQPIAVNGRGFIVGQLGGIPINAENPTCLNDMAQVETYHGDEYIKNNAIPGNHVFPKTCSDSLFVDYKWYHLESFVSADRKIGYKIFDENLKLIHSSLMQDPYNYISGNLTDWFVGHVFDTRIMNSSVSWSMTLKNIQLSESNAAIEDFFIEPVLNFYLANTVLADNSLVSLNDLGTKILSIGEFGNLRTRIYGCAGPAINVDSGACSNKSEFRVINRSSDGSFVSAGSRLNTLASSLDSYPSDIYKLVIRVNPDSDYKQITVRIQK